MIYYYKERPCEHGELGLHFLSEEERYIERYDTTMMGRPVCPGGSRHEITVDYEAAARRFDVEDMVSGATSTWERRWTLPFVRRVVDAALGFGEDRMNEITVDYEAAIERLVIELRDRWSILSEYPHDAARAVVDAALKGLERR